MGKAGLEPINLRRIEGPPKLMQPKSLQSKKSCIRFKMKRKKTTKKKNGLYKEGNGKFCYYQNNKRIKNTWKTIKGGKYYFDKNGYALIGSSKVGRTLYLFKADGKLYKRNRNGFVKVLGNTYYVLKSGELRTGWSGCYGTRNFRTPYKQLRKVRFD